jgi:hypothetical protein
MERRWGGRVEEEGRKGGRKEGKEGTERQESLGEGVGPSEVTWALYEVKSVVR